MERPQHVFNILIDIRESVQGNRRTENFYKNKNYRKANFKSFTAHNLLGVTTLSSDMSTLNFLIPICVGPPVNSSVNIFVMKSHIENQ